MPNHPDAIDFLLDRKFPSYTPEVAEHYSQLDGSTKGGDRVERIAKAMIERFGYSSLVDDDDHDSPASNESEQAVRVANVLSAADEYEDLLIAMNERDFLALYDQEKLKSTRLSRQIAGWRDAEMFFNSPDARADLRRWRLLAYLTVDEAAALSLGKDPNVVNSATMVVGSEGPFERKSPPLRKDSPFLDVFERWREQINRAFHAGQLGTRITPSSLIEWVSQQAETVGSLPRQVRLSLGFDVRGSADWEERYQEAAHDLEVARERVRELEGKLDALRKDGDEAGNPHQIAKLYSMIIGMAHAKFHYPSRATTGSIHGSLLRAGVKVDNGTIPKILETARTTLEWRPPLDSK